VPSSKPDVIRKSVSAAPVPATSAHVTPPMKTLVNAAATVGVIAAGIALLDLALIPGVVIGGAAVLAPSLLPRLRRGLQPMLRSALSARTGPKVAVANRPEGKALIAAPGRSRSNRRSPRRSPIG
jgi:hypothetical protein